MNIKGYNAGSDGATMARVQPVITFDSLGDAQNALRAIDATRRMLVNQIAAVARKRSWSDSVKAMTVAEFRRTLDTMHALHRAIGEAHNLGGY
jgi:hypothetical protein